MRIFSIGSIVNLSRFFCLAALALIVPACDTARDQLGLDRTAPDEFAVIKRAPLSLPPDYNLRPPQPGAPRPQEQETSSQARQAVFGPEQTTQEQAAPADTESLLLQKAGSDVADPEIRRKLDTDKIIVDKSQQPVVERLFGFGGGSSDAEAGQVINPQQEAERLQKERNSQISEDDLSDTTATDEITSEQAP